MNVAGKIPLKNEPSTCRELPLDRGWPVVGHTLGIIRDPVGWAARMKVKHGETYAVNAFFQRTAILIGLEALEFAFLDKDQSLSNELGYSRLFGHLTDTSLLMMDFGQHRRHRQALNPAFKSNVLKGYLTSMDRTIAARMKHWSDGEQFLFYPAVKQLTLDVATNVFLGLEHEKDRNNVNAALTDMFGSVLSIIRLPVPGTRWYRGLKAQRYIHKMLRGLIPERRKSEGDDVFSQLCKAVDETGEALRDEEILGHLITFWVAGHDTLASSLSTLVYQLGSNPDWQERLASEIKGLGLGGRTPTLDDLAALPLCGYAFQEALRIMPPAISFPRATNKDVVFKGFLIPKGMQVSVSIYGVHHDEEIWPDPSRFDPMRFAPENTPKDRSRFAWVPFGGGAHKCIGMKFTEIQAKSFLINLLGSHRIELPPGYEGKMQMLPTPRPADNLPVRITMASA